MCGLVLPTSVDSNTSGWCNGVRSARTSRDIHKFGCGALLFPQCCRETLPSGCQFAKGGFCVSAELSKWLQMLDRLGCCEASMPAAPSYDTILIRMYSAQCPPFVSSSDRRRGKAPSSTLSSSPGMLLCLPCPTWRPNLAVRTHRIPSLRKSSRSGKMHFGQPSSWVFFHERMCPQTLHFWQKSASVASRMPNLTLLLHGIDPARPFISRKHTAGAARFCFAYLRRGRHGVSASVTTRKEKAETIQPSSQIKKGDRLRGEAQPRSTKLWLHPSPLHLPAPNSTNHAQRRHAPLSHCGGSHSPK